MAVAPYNVESMIACENTQRKVDGAYMCYLHHLVGAGVRRTAFKMGNTNPAGEDMNELLGELRGRLSLEYKHLHDRVVPISKFIGLSIVRQCSRNGHGARKLPELPDAPRTERVASYAFAKDPVQIIPIQLHSLAQLRTISEAGLGSAKRCGASSAMASLQPLIHLPVSPGEKAALPIYDAVATFPAMGRANDPHVALHLLGINSEDSTPQYIEQIVPRSSLTIE
ncbi:MAG TPA: hypothetical protein VN031_03050 [Candidatus Microsaccharimonas sp.]|nr:hypothetical protein [Candidatus Microsaccharimonas sp.]